MAIHRFERSQSVPGTPEKCWEFFSDPRNLARITPPELGFVVVSEPPARIHPGLMIEYRVTPLPGIPMTWLTEITHVEEPHFFVDEQRIGPYRVWHHEHRFTPGADGMVTLHDLVTYAMPFGPLGELAHPFLVEPQLRRIFDYRARVVTELFPPTADHGVPSHNVKNMLAPPAPPVL